MIVYLDTSVILSRLLNQPNRLASWGNWERCYTSELTRIEFMRTVDRLRLKGDLSDKQRASLHEQFEILWQAVHRVALSAAVLDRASEPMPTVLGTLDAIHLVTARMIARMQGEPLILLTHDAQLAVGARAMALPVEGA